jgi:hypothetical protein
MTLLFVAINRFDLQHLEVCVLPKNEALALSLQSNWP